MNTKFTLIIVVLAVKAMFINSLPLLMSYTTILNKVSEHKYIHVVQKIDYRTAWHV